MQNKYLSALRTTYANFGFSKEALDRVASQRVKTIANEEEIDADIASRDTFLLLMKEMQGATDSLRASNAKIQKELDDFKKPQTDPAPVENPFAAEMAQMREMLVGMQSKLAESEKKARNEATIKEVHARMKSMGCTNDFIREATLAGLELNESDTPEALAQQYKSIYDTNCKKTFGEGYVPPKGNNAGGKDEVDYSSMVAGLMASGAIPNNN